MCWGLESETLPTPVHTFLCNLNKLWGLPQGASVLRQAEAQHPWEAAALCRLQRQITYK